VNGNSLTQTFGDALALFHKIAAQASGLYHRKKYETREIDNYMHKTIKREQ